MMPLPIDVDDDGVVVLPNVYNVTAVAVAVEGLLPLIVRLLRGEKVESIDDDAAAAVAGVPLPNVPDWRLLGESTGVCCQSIEQSNAMYHHHFMEVTMKNPLFCHYCQLI
jgi:hypothetical protein